MTADIAAAAVLAAAAAFAIGWKMKLLLDIIRLESAVRKRSPSSVRR